MAVKLFALPAGCACVAGCVAFSSSLLASGNPVAGRVAADFAAQVDASVWHYSVPAMSEIQRLADVYPSDGTPNGTVRIVAAKDEYEPGSFLVWARRDLGKVKFELSEFKQVKVKGQGQGQGEAVETGVVFPKENLDLKVVKVWYQNRNAWFSYFGDTGFKLCPELLLNDEDLIRVDTKKTANYAKLVDKDGKKSELWINPPRQLDVRKLCEGWRETDTFLCMSPNFHDAPTLQPVALPKNEFRNFFLTAHVTKEIPAGLYKGEIVLSAVQPSTSNLQPAALGRIPVEIRVLDFTLPQPKCYGEPEKDFLVSSYSYISYGILREYNGFDDALARRQLVAVLKNQVAHNQTMHMVRGNLSEETYETIEAMRQAGMRLDVFQGGVYPSSGKPEEMRARAEVIADEFDRRYGHHNVYMGWGDEPGADWLAQQRPLFEAYQSVGLKFFIAGETVFSKAGYLYDWHNTAHDAADDMVPALWGRMHNASHIAWYANQHVGSENPAFNRRQNGLGAYLAGYTALCNYAHHFGAYNDDRLTYKPMVLAYGSYDGVIDTIAWEGFREGIDDIRYATLMTDLARKAEKSKDIKVRYLGAKAMQYLAMTDPKACDQDAVRGEMIRFISELKPLVAPYAVGPEPKADAASAKAAAKRADERLQQTMADELAKLPAARGEAGTNKVHEAVAAACRRLGRPEEADAYLKKVGRTPKKSVWDRIPDDLSLVKGEFMETTFGKLKPTDTNGWKRAIGSVYGSLDRNPPYVWGLRPAALAAVYEQVKPLAAKWGVVLPSGTAKNVVWAYVQLKNPKAVADAAREGLKDEKAKPDIKYYLGLAAAMEKVRGRPDAFFKAAKKYDETVKDVPNEDRVTGLCAYGSAVMLTGAEDAVRGLNDFRKSLYKPEPKKRYVVKYSETPITGFSDWAKVTAEKQSYDRRYGGNMDFLETDVTSGNRAVGNSKEKLSDPTMEVVADANGIHFLIRIADPKALEVKMGLVGNCSFEGYIAPGANTPYACFMYEPQPGRGKIFNTTYPTFVERRLSASGPDAKCRFQSEYVEGEARHYLFFSWENWMQRVPRNGTVWDFENMCWHRSGNSCWNGTETIHGRSTWGELEFALTPEQRAQIVKGVLVAAYRGYNGEKQTRADYDGALAHWQDTALGDREFFAAEVKPLRQQLDEYGKLITADMPDSTVFWLEKNALPLWQDVRFEVDRRRARWLLERNAR